MSLQLDLYNWQSGQILCFVSKPDTERVVLEVEIDRHAIGQDVLDKVCDVIGTVEKDYLGLQLYSPKNKDSYWLNLRNRLVGQLSGQPPYRLRLRVKYFVKPHLLLQESTRQIYYFQLRQDIIDGRLNVPHEKIPKLAAYLTQVDQGNYNKSESFSAFQSIKFGEHTLDAQDMQSIATEHSSLEGTSKSKAMYTFLTEVAELPSYGTEIFYAKVEVSSHHGTNTDTNALVRVGPFGLEIVEEKTEDVKRLPFTAVQLATHTGRMIDVDTVQDDGSIITLSFKMGSEKASNALYRCVTEMLAFFTWETVHSTVIHQYSRDFKGHLLALFRPDVADQGKQYVFDVQRTCREACDNARRILYKQNLKNIIPTGTDNNTTSPPLAQQSQNCSADKQEELELLRKRLTDINDALTCLVCMDKEINSVFWPCGHQVCCHDCANHCEACPVCRCEIEKSQVVYHTLTRDFVSTGNIEMSESEGASSSPMCTSPRNQSPVRSPNFSGQRQRVSSFATNSYRQRISAPTATVED